MMKRQIAEIHLDPRTKLILTLVTSVVAMTGYRGMILAVKPYFFCLPFLLLLFWKKPFMAVKLAVLYAVLLYWEKIFFFLPTGAWRETIQMIAAIIASLMPCLVMGYYMIASTKISEFIAAMQKLHISQQIIIPFVVLFRFFPTITEEYHHIKDAMQIRGISFKCGPVVMMEYRLVPLMISLVKTGDDLSAAAATRGLSPSERRSNLCSLNFGLIDFVIIIFSVAVFIIFLASGVSV